jgi:thioredoxin reductase (NADPH)
MTRMTTVDLLIVGAGPAGLATAIAARGRGIGHVIIDQGSVADAIRRFPTTMTFFSTSEQIEVGGIPFVSSGARPTRIEAVRYYQTVARRSGLHVVPHERVQSIRPAGSFFRVETASGAWWEARNVVVATGYFDTPRPIDVPGSDLPLVHRSYLEPFAYAGESVVVVGGRNSAVETALDLYRAGAKVTLVHRGEWLSDGVKPWILPDVANRIKEGSIRALLRSNVKAFRHDSVVVDGPSPEEIPCRAAFVMIGYAPDTSLVAGAGAEILPETEGPAYNPETYETTVRGLYVAGSLAAGRFNNAIFIENGRLHGAAIAASIARK